MQVSPVCTVLVKRGWVKTAPRFFPLLSYPANILACPAHEKRKSHRHVFFFFSRASYCHVLSLSLLLNVRHYSVDRSFKSALVRILLLGFEVKIALPFQLLSGVVGALLLLGPTFEREEPNSPNVDVGNDYCIRSDGNIFPNRGADSADGERALRPALVYVR